MEQQCLLIAGIPAILWGPATDKLMIAVHGDQSHKADDVIKLLAEEAVAKGFQVVSFDLPEHGDRVKEPRLCKVQHCIEDLGMVMNFVRPRSSDISLFGCSIGAYFSLLAYRDESIRQTLLLSPIVDMKRIIDNIMAWCGVTVKSLEKQQQVETAVKVLYWDYYQYVISHPIIWNKPTFILYGTNDTVSEFEYVSRFAESSHAEISLFKDGDHFFHTEKQLAYFRLWLKDNLVA